MTKQYEVAGRFFVPIDEIEKWRLLLARPDRHWKTGYSARTLAYCWLQAGDFPPEVRQVFRESGVKAFEDIKLLIALPEHKVPLPGGRRPSQSDLFVLGKGGGELVSIAVEGKVSEPFGETVADWKVGSGQGREKRLAFLCDLLDLDIRSVDGLRYQLLHRTASALIEAQRFGASKALMMVHSFGPRDDWFDDYQRFLGSLETVGHVGCLIASKRVRGVGLHFAWVKGNPEYLNR